MELTRMTPQILTRCQDETLLRVLTENNNNLDIILKKLQQFLETKGWRFPGFILSQTRNCFRFCPTARTHTSCSRTSASALRASSVFSLLTPHDILAMESSEGEVVQLIRKVNPGDYQNLVEQWLQALEKVMRDTILDQLRQATGDYATRKKRTEFIRAWPGQVVIAGLFTLLDNGGDRGDE
ncbi:putative dynein heavy chain [Trypanosoma cruzi]|uniref:Putative dynein heavy chain n=1 Tax=Trypanosoma cruzi TaxID=5693 RepID=A0A2V2VPR0_TRYCR|nr:putative dynein heavy chain [Trypanosoma cruzi]